MASDSIHTYYIPVRWSDFDRYGHIMNANYVEIAQEARLALQKTISIHKILILLPLSATSIWTSASRLNRKATRSYLWNHKLLKWATHLS